ncbi:DUF4214 domain-containing protein [Vogesella indigofera]|uniref:DUF4214 domain-containing protein n=1 Tax=Vogesella indigofera TaxID=45465 RepID=UPI00234DB28B|nr:DUF4214 domain-containing protein [Vogesella indigofera]MDC7702727.1 DUF4214 domain-containing protein [Vogesella indigofera]
MQQHTTDLIQTTLADHSVENGKALAVIDTTVTHWESIVSELPAGMDVLLLAPERDGLTQLREWADSHAGYAAIHVFSHGAAGVLSLAGSRYDLASLDNRADDWAAVGKALTDQGDLLLYGCNIGAQQAFIDKLTTLTQADLAGSADLTGNAASGGNWVLEEHAGQIETATLQADSFDGVLVDATFDFGTGSDSLTGSPSKSYTSNGETITFTVTSGAGNLYFAEDASSNFGGILGGTDFINMSDRTMSTSIGDDTVNTVRINVPGKTFDLSGFSFYDFMEAGSTITLTSNKGSTTFTANTGYNANTVSLTGNTSFQGVQYVDVTSNTGGFLPMFDNVELKNITAPNPTVTSVSSSKADGSYKAGDVIAITVTFSEAVNVTGTPQLTLETGATDRVVNYTGGTGTATLTFSYTVQAGDTTADLDYASTTALALNGGTIKNATNYDATLTLPTPGASGSLGANKALVIDTTTPTVNSVTVPANAGYVAGQHLDFTVNFSENITLTGTSSTLGLTIGSSAQNAAYLSNTANSITYRYTVQSGDLDSDGISVGTLTLNTDTLKDAAGNDASLTLNSVGATSSVLVDAIAPTATAMSSSTADGSYKTGDVIAITVQFSEAVTVTGTPQLTLETGSTDRVVNYASGSGTSTLTFNYTVQAGDTSTDLDYVASGSLALNGGTIKDAAGNNATLTLATPGAAGSLGNDKAIVIDGVAPTVTSVSASTADGSYNTGDTVIVTVTFNEAVTVDTTGGTPRLKLETGATDQYAGYVSGSGGNTLTFSYTVQAGDTSTDLDYTTTNALELNSGTIKDAAGNNATLTLATPGAAGSLGANKALLINPPPTITSATYDADSGALVVTATGLTATSGAANDIIANKLTLTGEGGSTYTLTDTANVEISSATGFTLILSATDKAAANLILNKNGTSSTSGTTFNLSAAEDWAAGADVSLVVADLTGNGITVSNVATPTITSATYDYGTNTLVVTGTGLVSKAGASNDIDISKLAITGQGGASYTLSSASDVEITSGTSFSVTLSGSDLVNVEALLNKNGTAAQDSTTFNLAAGEDWATGADAAVVVADTTGNGMTVSNWTAPAINSTTFDWATGQLVLTGSNFVPASGGGNDIIAGKLTFTGEGGNTYTLSDSSNVEIGSDSSATITLSATDLLAVRGMLNKNGTQSPDSTSYNLAAAEDWMAGSPVAENIADATTGITVSNVTVPTITSASYDADTGILSVTGSNLFRKTGAGNDVDISRLTLTGGTANATYTLTSASDVEITSASSFSITLSGADKTAVDALLDQLGTTSTGGSTYNLAAADDWLAGADSAADVSDATNAVTVSVNPKLASATYDVSTGTLVVTGSNLQANGSGADIDASTLTLTGEGGVTYTLTDTADVERDSATQFTLTLSATDKAAANLILNKNGTSSTGGTTFNLAAADDWNTQVTTGDTADTTGNGITVGNVAAPAITSATYNAATGTLVVTGTGLLKRDGSTNDIVASKFTLTGEGGSTYTLTDSANVEVSSGTGFTLTLSATDKAAANLILNKNGTSSTGGTTFNLAAAEDWAAGADAAVVIADTTGNGVTVSNVAVPTITSATYNEGSGVLTVTGTGFLKLDGAANDIDVGKLKISGDSTEYTLTSSNVDITSATSFSITLNATDKTALASRLNKDGTSSTGNVTYNLAAAEDWAQGADTAVETADLAGNGINVTLTPPAPPPATNTDDQDGVSDTIENAVPTVPDSKGNTIIGDGNGDGYVDSNQANVSSVAFLNTTTAQSNPADAQPVYVTLVADSDAGKTGATATAALSDVKQLDKPADAPADLDMPLGLIAFKANAGSAGASKGFSLYVDSSVSVNGYWKKLGNDWVNLASEQYGGKVVSEGGKTRLDFTIEDGGQFDNDGKADGVITDPGAIGFRTGNSSDNDQFPDALEAANGLQVGVKDNDVFGSSKFFVMQLYRDTLFREAENDGLVYWQKQLDSGTLDRAQITSAFLDSAEFQAGAGGIARLYSGALDRLPDNDGLAYWVGQWQNGKTLAQIAADFVASAEFGSHFEAQSLDSFVDRLYQSVLGRQADTEGKAYWVQQLGDGTNKGDVVLAFSESAEYKKASDAEVSMVLNYLGLLDRAPDQAGFDYWLDRAQQGTPEIDIIGQFLATQEYHDRFLP